jgi:methylamine dehydrogenase accessory protein MauD
MLLSMILLWLVVIGLIIVVFALARQIGVLHERIAPAGALMVNQRIRAGEAAPSIPVTTLNGDPVMVGGIGRRQLLFFLAPDCPICKSLLPVLKSVTASAGTTDVVLLSDGDDPKPHRDYVAAQKLEAFPYALSEVVGRTYGVGKLPYAVLIDAAGKVVSLGIVNSREHLESLFESERLGVASIQDYLAARQSGTVQQFDPTRK